MRVSVIIPCYNASRYIGETIESALQQTHPPAEIIVVDDISSDDSVAVAGRYPVIMGSTRVNSGPAEARNVGASLATGDVIALLDSDDLWRPDHLATIVGMLEGHPDAGVAFTCITRFNETGDLAFPAAPHWPADAVFDAYDLLLARNFIAPSALVVRRPVWDLIGGFESLYRSAEDYEFFLRLGRATPFIATHRETVRYRLSLNQMSKNLDVMVRWTWSARVRELHLARAVGRIPAQRIISKVWRDSLAAAIANRSPQALAAVLAVADEFPENAAYARRYRTLLRGWPLVGRIFKMWDGLSPGSQHRVRRLLGRTPLPAPPAL